MKEIALYVLDIAQNSITAGAAHVDITLAEEDGDIAFTIADDGRGMSPQLLATVSDPFTTTRTTRKMGLGLPLLRLAAEQTGGSLDIESTLGVGTTVRALFRGGHIDCPPVGDMAGTVTLLVQGAPELELTYVHRAEGRSWRPARCGRSWGRASPWRSRRWSSGCGTIYRNRKHCLRKMGG